MAISSPGVGSNLDVNGIVSKLMQVESQPLVRLAQQEASYQAKLSAYGSLNSALSSFKSAVDGLNDLSKYNSYRASSSDSSILSGSASSSAAAGTYNIEITKLSQAHTLLAAGQSSSTNGLGNGATTLSFRFGTAGTPSTFGSAKTVSISANSSLQEIAAAVNAANVGVSASIVNDGSSLPYRLVFTSTSTGAAQSMSVTTADATLQGFLSYDQVGTDPKNMTQTAVAQDAALTVNGVGISSPSNSVTGAINGVTLSLAKVGSSTLTVARDTNSVQSAVQAFVKAYNDFNKTVADLSGYDATTKKAGPLQGDSVVRTVQYQARRALSTALTGVGGNLTTLSQVGVSFNKDGSLALDSSKLSSAISTNFADVAALFAAAGKATDTLVGYVGSTSRTQPGSYAVNVSQLATQGSSVGSVDLTVSPTTIDPGTSINVTLDGVSSLVALTAGSYTSSQLATLIQSAINSTSVFSSAGSSVVAAINGSGHLSLTSSRYGSSSALSLADGAGTVVSTFMGTATSAAGVNVAGTINGADATGSGQTMTGATGNAAEGLQIKISGGATGARGTVDFSHGYAYRLSELLGGYLGSPNLVSSRTDGINRSIQDINDRREFLSRQLAATEQRYRDQFTRLDTLISNMNQTSAFLTQQLANLPSTSGSG